MFLKQSKGRHPFGDKLRRQANILSGEYDLSDLAADITGYCLIEKMLSIDPLERPPAHAILKHPIFWQTEKVLAFFQDVSDRVEKDSTDSVVLQSLERSAYDVVRANWKMHIEEVVMDDLKRHRTYQSRSVRDLLRALRNKVSFVQIYLSIITSITALILPLATSVRYLSWRYLNVSHLSN